MTRPDTSHWRQCDDDDCLLCESRRAEFDEKARALCLAYGYPLNREVEAATGGDGGD